MILLSFSHPLSDKYLTQIEPLTGQEIECAIVNQQSGRTQQPLALESASMGEALG